MICLLCLPLLAIWTSPKAKLFTIDCLEADRLKNLLQASSAGPDKSCKQAMEAISLVVCVCCAINTAVDTPSSIVVSTDWLLIA